MNSNAVYVSYDCTYDQCQFENIGNALIGDGLTPGATFTGSISGTTLTVTSITGTPLGVGHNITGVGISGGPYLISAFGTGTGGTGTYTLSSSPGTISSELLTARRTSYIWNTRFTGCEFLWGTEYGISALPQTAIFQLYQAFGLYIEHPVITFGWTPGTDGLFDITELVNSAAGSYTPTEIFSISGDVSTLLGNCQTAGLPFFGHSSAVGVGAARLDNQDFWQAEASYASGYSSTALGSIVIGNEAASNGPVSAGTSADVRAGHPAAPGAARHRREERRRQRRLRQQFDRRRCAGLFGRLGAGHGLHRRPADRLRLGGGERRFRAGAPAGARMIQGANGADRAAAISLGR